MEECLQLEYRVMTRLLASADVREGVRAASVDKDLRAVWQPAALHDVRRAALDACFAPLGADEWRR